MYARTVTVDMSTDSWEDMLAFGAAAKEQIAAFPGLRSWTLVGDRETGEGTSFAVFDSREAFEAVNDQVNGILAELGQYLTSPPRETLGEVLVHVDNA